MSVDLVGYSLHQRGYRLAKGGAPLKENIAAAILLRAKGSNGRARFALVDPFCGSGTLLVEAALMATHTAPGLFRMIKRCQIGADIMMWFGSSKKIAEGKRQPLQHALYGFDVDPRAIEVAKDNIERAGFSKGIVIKQQSIHHYKLSMPTAGLLVCNPPYGERLKDPLVLLPVYQAIGEAYFIIVSNLRPPFYL